MLDDTMSPPYTVGWRRYHYAASHTSRGQRVRMDSAPNDLLETTSRLLIHRRGLYCLPGTLRVRPIRHRLQFAR